MRAPAEFWGVRVNVPLPLALGASAVAAYWVALLAGVHTPLVARWGLIVLLAAPAVLILRRAAKHRERRFAWAALGSGLLCTAFGWVLQPQSTPLPAPGIADVFWLAMYPCVLATFAALARPGSAARRASSRSTPPRSCSPRPPSRWRSPCPPRWKAPTT